MTVVRFVVRSGTLHKRSQTGSHPTQPPTQWATFSRVKRPGCEAGHWPLTINYGPILKNALITLRSPYKFAWHRVSSNTRATSYLLSINTDRHDTPIIRPFSALTLTDPELSHQLFSVHIIVVTQDPYDSPRWPELTPRTLHVGFASARVALGQLVFGVLGLSAVNSIALLHDTHSFICNRR